MKTKYASNSSYIFAMPSFIRGMAHALDLGNTLTVYNECEDAAEADARAIYSDWRNVGSALEFAMECIEDEEKE